MSHIMFENPTLTLALFSSPQDWLIILVIVLVLFGGTKIPQLMRGVGQGMSEFQKGVQEGKQKTNEDEK